MAAISATTIALVSLGVAAAGTAFSVVQQQSAAKQQKKARRAQQQQQSLQARRQRTQAIRQQQIAASQARASAGALGGLETSGFRGGQAGLQSSLGAGLGFGSQMSGLSRNISMYQQKAANAMGLARMGQAFAGLGMQGASLGMQMGGTTGSTPARLPTGGTPNDYGNTYNLGY
tara:strand:+ start:83 stop:604 length:522 start_codon:yes stop_codon:yes gene_type:complete